MMPPAQPRWENVEGRPSTPAPTMAVMLWYRMSPLNSRNSRSAAAVDGQEAASGCAAEL
jgi:hypothetical protein